MGGNHFNSRSHTSNTLLHNTKAPQGCECCPLLFKLYTHGCIAGHGDTSNVKFMDDTFIIGQIANNDENLYWEKINNLEVWSTENTFLVIVSKTKELKMDFRKKEAKTHTCVYSS